MLFLYILLEEMLLSTQRRTVVNQDCSRNVALNKNKKITESIVKENVGVFLNIIDTGDYHGVIGFSALIFLPVFFMMRTQYRQTQSVLSNSNLSSIKS